MTGVQWLKLDRTNLSEISEEMGKLVKLVGICCSSTDSGQSI